MRPILNATAVTANDIPALLDKALFNGERITNPESQKTGIETMYPMMLIAWGTLRFPTTFRTASAMDIAPPDFSKM